MIIMESMHELQEKLLTISRNHDLGKLSLRQIGKLIGQEDAPQKVKHHLLALQKRGLLEVDREQNTVAPVQSGPIGKSKLIALPILGAANCGPAMVLAEQQALGYIHISGKLLVKKRGIFGIKASGYSMNKANINGECIEDGDYVVVDPEYRSIRNGDYVLSIINGAANIKRYFKDSENRRIILLSESSADTTPIFIHFSDMDNYLINGKVVQVIKKPKTAWSKLKRFVSSQS
jgi:SOS-response transcriptional repressor LexA